MRARASRDVPRPGRTDRGVIAGQWQPGGRHQSGTSLVEVLVTVMLLTLGITALSDLQVTALKLSHSAYMRSQAVALSYRLLDAMRANRGAALTGAYDRALDDPVPTAAEAGASIAAADLRAWLLSVENTLRPYDGQAAIARDVREVRVTLRWRDRLREERLGARGSLWESFRVVTEL